MEKTAISKYLRTSAKKLRILINNLKGQKAVLMLQKLELQPQKGAELIASTLKSAINLFEEPLREQLTVKNIMADQGPVFKRWRAGSKGAAKKYSKKTAHLHITLEIKDKAKTKNGKQS